MTDIVYLTKSQIKEKFGFSDKWMGVLNNACR